MYCCNKNLILLSVCKVIICNYITPYTTFQQKSVGVQFSIFLLKRETFLCYCQFWQYSELSVFLGYQETNEGNLIICQFRREGFNLQHSFISMQLGSYITMHLPQIGNFCLNLPNLDKIWLIFAISCIVSCEVNRI